MADAKAKKEASNQITEKAADDEDEKEADEHDPEFFKKLDEKNFS